MKFRPTTRDLETIAELGNARASVDKIAAALGITPAEFSAWAGRLAVGRALDVAGSLPQTDAPYVASPGAVTNPRIVADRLFECGTTKGSQPSKN